MIHSNSTSYEVARKLVPTEVLGLFKTCGILGVGLCSAMVVFGTSTAEANYYYRGHGYYGYGYSSNYRASRSYKARKRYSRRKYRKYRRSRTKQVKQQVPVEPVTGPVTVVVSTGEQRVRVFDRTKKVADSPTSTGKRRYATLRGVFSIIQKNRRHYSNLYAGAPMPYMQRLTWTGTALHKGHLPGYPASHGCIRLPQWFASRLWRMTKLGTRVIVARHGVEPVDISHAKLESLKRMPTEPDFVPIMVEGAAGKTAAKEGPVTDGLGTPMPSLLVDETEASTVPGLSDPPSVPVTPIPLARPDLPEYEGPPAKPLKTGPLAIFISKKEGRLFVRKGFEPLFDLPVTIEDPERPLGTHVYTATEFKDDGQSMRWTAISLPPELRSTKRSKRKSRRSAEKVPVPKPAVNGAPAMASAALDRVELSDEALYLLSDFLKPGSSLTISDKGLGRYTGKGTGFIVISR